MRGGSLLGRVREKGVDQERRGNNGVGGNGDKGRSKASGQEAAGDQNGTAS